MRRELEKTQKSFADLKNVLDKTRSSIADFGIQKEALEGQNRELQKRLSEIESTAAGMRKEKEELQRTLSESRTSVRNSVKHDKLGGSVYLQRADLQVSKHSDARNAHSNLGEPHRWSQEKRPRDGNMNAEAGDRRELEMMERQLYGVQEFVTAMDTILGLGDAILTEDLKTALRRDCGGQGRLLEKLMLQREELEAWREELIRERALTKASMQDLEDVLNGLDPFAVRKCTLLNLRKKRKKTKTTPTLPPSVNYGVAFFRVRVSLFVIPNRKSRELKDPQDYCPIWNLNTLNRLGRVDMHLSPQRQSPTWLVGEIRFTRILHYGWVNHRW